MIEWTFCAKAYLNVTKSYNARAVVKITAGGALGIKYRAPRSKDTFSTINGNEYEYPRFGMIKFPANNGVMFDPFGANPERAAAFAPSVCGNG